MKPSIGRIVIYRYPEGVLVNGVNVCPAMIVRVWSDTMVNLKLIEDGELVVWRTSVSAGTEANTWSWPERV